MKFEIHPPQQKKKFEIQNQENQKKKFEVTSKWFKQTNEHDCGPCLILNALGKMNVGLSERNVAEVRTEINRLRSVNNQEGLQQDRWIFADDIEKLLRKYGLDVKEYALFLDDKNETLDSINKELDKQFDLIVSTSGSHFRGIIKNPQTSGEYLLLDSFSDGPQNVDGSVLNNFIEQGFNAPAGRVEKIIIARKTQDSTETSSA